MFPVHWFLDQQLHYWSICGVGFHLMRKVIETAKSTCKHFIFNSNILYYWKFWNEKGVSFVFSEHAISWIVRIWEWFLDHRNDHQDLEVQAPRQKMTKLLQRGDCPYLQRCTSIILSIYMWCHKIFISLFIFLKWIGSYMAADNLISGIGLERSWCD